MPSMMRKVGLPSISLRRWFCWRVVVTRSPQVRLRARLRQNDESESLGRWYRSRLLSREQLHPARRDQAPPVRGAGESIVISPTVHGGGVARLRPCAACPRTSGPASASPSRTRSRTSGQEDPAHDQDPHDADDGRAEPRISAVRCPESTAQPRGAAQQDEHDGCDPRREEPV